jgi:adenylate kinase
VSGGPATGKKTIGRALADSLGLRFVSVIDEAMRLRAGRSIRGELEINPSKLYGKIDTRNAVVCGHLISEVIPPKDIDFVAVLRCSPKILRERYLARGYPPKKVRENLEAEFLDIVSFETLKVFGMRKVSEFDTSRIRNPQTVVSRIVETLEGRRKREYGIARWSQNARRRRKFLQYLEELG